jgi:hypothetical protein
MIMAIVLAAIYSGSGLTATAVSRDEIEQAIDRGIVWLVEQQEEDGSWPYWEDVAGTAFALVKLEDRAFELGSSPFDPGYAYSGNVVAGLDYLFSRAEHPTTCCGDHVVFGPGHNETYNTGIAMMAIAASKAPARVVDVPGSVVDGWTYRRVLQANVEYFACSQIDDGGWRYECGEEWADNSATGYVTLGLAYAEAPVYGFQCTIPGSLKDGLDGWIDLNQITGETPHRGGSGYSGYDDTSNLLRAGNLVFEMAFVGDTADSTRMQKALDYIGRAWNDPDWSWWDIHSYPGWYGNPDWHGEPIHQEEPPEWWQGLEERWHGWQGPHYQAMYCLMKGLSLAEIDTIDVEGESVDWYDAFAERILETQRDDGRWPRDYWGGDILATEWALLTLEKISPRRVVPVDIKPESCPNPLNLRSGGVLPVAILGTNEIDVAQIDPASVRLEGVAPLRWAMADVATPFYPYVDKEACDLDCTEEGPDGYGDLTLKFKAQEVVAALGEVEDGDCLVLQLTGNLKEEYGGGPFVGEDVVWILKKGK